MLQRCRLQTSRNPNFKELPLIKVKDVVFQSGERATFDFNFETKEFNTDPAVVIKKDRIDDINIKCSSRIFDPESTLRSDLRISCNSEVPASINLHSKQKSSRIKERTTFTFQWMRLDFTVAQM